MLGDKIWLTAGAWVLPKRVGWGDLGLHADQSSSSSQHLEKHLCMVRALCMEASLYRKIKSASEV